MLEKQIPDRGLAVGEILLNNTGLQALRDKLHRFEVGMVEATSQGMSQIVLPFKVRA